MKWDLETGRTCSMHGEAINSYIIWLGNLVGETIWAAEMKTETKGKVPDA
jgi:hypothetical protein